MENDYYSLVRYDILCLLEKNKSQKILEVGCAKGETLKFLKENGYAAFVAGIEKEQSCFGQASINSDLFIGSDIETLHLEGMGKFDVILLLDVLEHLRDPYDFLARIPSVLTKTGYVIVSLPNVRNLSVLKRLLVDGTWDYGKSGILDWGHLRFFTKKSFLAKLREFQLPFEIERLCLKPNRNTLLAKLLTRVPFVSEFFVCQFVYRFKLSR